jgi:hypothetical protein
MCQLDFGDAYSSLILSSNEKLFVPDACEGSQNILVHSGLKLRPDMQRAVLRIVVLKISILAKYLNCRLETRWPRLLLGFGDTLDLAYRSYSCAIGILDTPTTSQLMAVPLGQVGACLLLVEALVAKHRQALKPGNWEWHGEALD